MAINERVITGTTAAAGNGGAADAEQGLIVHLDASDVDSYDGDGSVWYDISTHEVTVPLSDNADDLELHLNASDTTSYGGTGTTWADISGNDRDGTINGAPPYSIDRYGSFDFTQSTGDYISLTTNSALQPASGGTSYEFWITPDTSAGTNTLLYYGDSTGYGFWLWNNYGTPYVTAYNSSNGTVVNLSSGHSISNNTLAHVVFTLSSDTNPVTKIYVDGELKASTTGSGTIRKDSAVNILLGRYTTGNPNDYEGKMHACRVYSKELSASDVGQNYRHGIDFVYTDLNSNSDLFLHYDPADTNSYSGTGTTLTDLVGNNNADLLGGIESGWDEELGNSFPMTGSGDGITTSSAVSINPATDGMTIEMWVKIKTDVQNYLFSFDGTATTYNGLSYRTNTDTIDFFYRTGANSKSTISSDTIVLNEWTHIVATTNGSSAQFYTNGVLSEETSSSAYSYTYNEDLHFGNMYDLAQNSNSDIGQIRFYKGQLSADEVLQNYVATKNNYPNGINASLTNVSWTADYFEIDSTSDAIEFGDGLKSYLDGLTTALSTSCWLRFDDLDATQNMISYYNSSKSDGANFVQWMNSSGKLRYWIFTTSGNTQADTSSICVTANTWHHVVMVLDMSKSQTNGTGGRVQIFVDGTEQSISYTTTGSNTLKTSDAAVKPSFGFSTNSSGVKENHFDGRVSKIKIFDKALTQAEVTALEAEGSGN